MADSGRFATSGSEVDVAVIIVTYNSARDISRLIADLRRATESLAIQVIIADNDSSDGTAERVAEHPDVMLVRTGGNLGYAAGVNRAATHLNSCRTVLILNPDLRVQSGALEAMLVALERREVGAVVPRIVDDRGVTYPSLRMEPSLLATAGDVFLGRMWPSRHRRLSETRRMSVDYLRPGEVDWATGAAMMIRAEVTREIGDWNEDYFLYSEETDYFRRIRNAGYTVWFEPGAVVEHQGGGSGTSPDLSALMAVNKVRYVAGQHGRLYAAVFRGLIAIGELRRARDPAHRRALRAVLDRESWADLPRASTDAAELSHRSGAVIIPAHNEVAVIARAIRPLAAAAVAGQLEVVVACNGCTDNTVDIVRSFGAVKLVEIDEASKVAALNAGDLAATLWPRMYLDADIQITPDAVGSVFDTLRAGVALAARPEARYDTEGATWPVRCYYRARCRIPQFRQVLWGAGAYALSEDGHRRIGAFPDRTADDLWVDRQFEVDEKAIVATTPTRIAVPKDSKTLIRTLRRVYRGSAEIPSASSPGSSLRSLVTTVRGLRSAFDAAVYVAFALAGRRQGRKPVRWERDETSRAG